MGRKGGGGRVCPRIEQKKPKKEWGKGEKTSNCDEENVPRGNPAAKGKRGEGDCLPLTTRKKFWVKKVEEKKKRLE